MVTTWGLLASRDRLRGPRRRHLDFRCRCSSPPLPRMRVDRRECGPVCSLCRWFVLDRPVDHGADEFKRVPARPARRRTPSCRDSRAGGSHRTSRRRSRPGRPQTVETSTPDFTSHRTAENYDRGGSRRCVRRGCSGFDLSAHASGTSPGDAIDAEPGFAAVSRSITEGNRLTTREFEHRKTVPWHGFEPR